MPRFDAFLLTALVLAACSGPDTDRTEVLDPVLGAVPASPDDARSRGLELAAYDLERFRRAGLDRAEAILPPLLERLVAPGTWDDQRRIEVREGKLFAVHRPEVVSEVGAVLDEILARADRPVALDVELREVPSGSPEIGEAGPTRKGRALARLAFGLANGRWGRQTTRSTRTYVSGLDVADGTPALRTAELVDGVVADAAVWRGPGDRAVLHLLLTLRTDAEPAQEIEVPPAGESPGFPLHLPRRLTVQLRGQALVEPGTWHLVALAPSPREGWVLEAMARARWAKRPDREPAPGIAILPVALPEGSEPQVAEGWLFDRTAKIEALDGEWQEATVRAQTVETGRVQNVAGLFSTSFGVDFQSSLGDLDAGSAVHGSADAAPPLFPPDLDLRWSAVRRADWGPSTHLAFAWDQVFVRQDPAVASALGEFLDRLHAWRNGPLRLRVEAVSVDPRLLDRVGPGPLPADVADTLRNRPTHAPLDLVLRSGTWARISAERESAVLAGHLVAGRSTPPLGTAADGFSLAARPRRYGDGRLEIELAWSARRVAPESLAARPLAGGFVQEARTAEDRVDALLVAREGATHLVLGSSAGEEVVPALLVTVE